MPSLTRLAAFCPILLPTSPPITPPITPPARMPTGPPTAPIAAPSCAPYVAPKYAPVALAAPVTPAHAIFFALSHLRVVVGVRLVAVVGADGPIENRAGAACDFATNAKCVGCFDYPAAAFDSIHGGNLPVLEVSSLGDLLPQRCVPEPRRGLVGGALRLQVECLGRVADGIAHCVCPAGIASGCVGSRGESVRADESVENSQDCRLPDGRVDRCEVVAERDSA